MNVRKTIATAALAAAGIATAMGVASPAQASYWHYAKTTVQWGGTNCINVADPYTGLETFCGYGNSWEKNENPYVGQTFGFDPIMGNADWIACQTYVDGQMVYADYASAGDGHDADCTRYLRW